MYDGHSAMQPGRVLGHEPVGVIDEVGSAVTGVKKGDRVVKAVIKFPGAAEAA